MESKKYILALDEGTTSARCVIFDRECNVVAVSQHEFSQIYPKPGWVEHSPMEIYANQYSTMTECIAKSGIEPSEIDSIGIANQRETTVVWNKNTGRPIYNAIVWQCRRTAQICSEIIEAGHSDYITSVTGLKPDAYFSATKIKWILDNVPDAHKMAEAGELLFGTIDTWLLWKLTNGAVHATDRTNASRTMLYDISEDRWDKRLLDIFGIPENMMPEIRSSSEYYGSVNIMGKEIPICSLVGDQQSALFGQCCFTEGSVKNTYGTGCFLLAHTGNERKNSSHGLITTVAASQKGEPMEYALEGSVFTGGAVIQWLRDEMRMIKDAFDSEYFAKKVKSSGGVYVVPAFSGLGAPHWDMDARGTIVGITRGTGQNEIIRASLESIAYQTDDLLQAMISDTGKDFTSLRVDGGASNNDFLMQFQADISNLTVVRSDQTEATAAGASFLSGLATGFFENREAVANLVKGKKTFRPGLEDREREEMKKGWRKAVKACKVFSEQ